MKIIDDCYWYIDKNNVGDASMHALCLKCREKYENEGKEFGWLWEGSKLGYGDYDLSCSLCQQVIYQREEDADKDKD